ncbi:MAG: hypothetical protein WC677_07605 [Clostridia bacterium]|jgi:hypothetical protein
MLTEIFKTDNNNSKLTVTPTRITLKIAKRHWEYPIEIFRGLVAHLEASEPVQVSYRGNMKLQDWTISGYLVGNSKNNNKLVVYDHQTKYFKFE